MNGSIDEDIVAPPVRWTMFELPRRATMASWYRRALGAAVTLHFVVRAATAALEHTWGAAAMGAACTGLGVLVTCGVFTPAAAIGMNLLAVILYRAVPMPALDDYAANLVPLLVLLIHPSESVPPSGTRSETTGLGVAVVCAAVLGVYVGGGPFAFFVDSGRGPAWIRWAFRLAAVLLVAPSSAFRASGVLTQICLHAGLFAVGPDRLLHVVFGASALLFLSRRSTSRRGYVVDAATLLSASAFVIAVAAYAGARFLEQDVNRSARVLAAVGLLPLPQPTSAVAGGPQ
jgi:hypothetical protein